VWVAATIVGACYGVFLISAAPRLPSALTHLIARERRWLISALLFARASVPSATPS
jgi:hypothetical protein